MIKQRATTADLKSPVVAIGTFDGVHVGHQKIIAQAQSVARRNKRPVLVVTFDPHPQHVVHPKRHLHMLTLLPERLEELYALGVDEVVVLPFNRRMMKLSAAEFTEQFLVNTLHLSELFVGYDFHFGHNRQGHAEELQKLGKKFRFRVHVMAPIRKGSSIVKSSAIRDFLHDGAVEKAAKLLGRPYVLAGRVGEGAHRGSRLGIPTANLDIPAAKLIPADGVYAGMARLDDRWFPCVINVGKRPTFGGHKRIVEVHLIGKKIHIRDSWLTVTFAARLRNEIKFQNASALVAQIRKDIARARAILKS